MKRAAKKPARAESPGVLATRKGARAVRKETLAAKRARTVEIIRRLRATYPDAHTALDHENAFQLIVATILSAQCTDERVNQVTPALFRRYPTPEDMAGAKPEELEELIRPTGFFRNKTKSLLGMSNALVDRHGGAVPASMEALVELPGVGRKTANVVLGNAFGIDEGVVVDTHVTRLSARLGLSAAPNAEAIERDLMKIVPREDWTDFSHLLIFHGREICRAPRPRCEACVLVDSCPGALV